MRRILVLLAIAAVVLCGVRAWRALAPGESAEREGERGVETPPGLAPAPPRETAPPAKDAYRVAGVVVGPGGTPISGAIVDLPRAGVGSEVATDANGRFRLALSGRESALTLRIRAVGWVGRTIEGFAPGGEDLVVELEPGKAISGVVLDPDGRPEPGAEVTTVQARYGRGTDPDAGRAITDAEGRFVLADLPEGVHLVGARSPRFWWSGDASVRAPATDVVLRLVPGFRLEGVVRDREGKPLQGATVEGGENSWLWGTVTDAQGRFMDCAPHPDWIFVYVNKEGFAGVLRQYVRTGGPPIAIVMEPAKSLEVRVLDPEGLPVTLPYRGGELRAPDGSSVPNTGDTSAGGLRFPAIGVGPYSLVIETERWQRRVVDGVRGGGPPVEVGMEPGLAVSGRCEAPEGDKWHVYAIPDGAKIPAPARDTYFRWAHDRHPPYRESSFTVRGLADGRHDLLVVVAKGDSAGVIVPDVAAGASDIEIKLPPAVAIEGSVSRHDGAPVPFERVQAYDARGLCRAWAHEGKAPGTFRIGNLEPGRYRLVAWLDEGTATLDDVAAPSAGVVISAK